MQQLTGPLKCISTLINTFVTPREFVAYLSNIPPQVVYIQGADTVTFLFLGVELVSDAQQALGVYLLNEWMMGMFWNKWRTHQDVHPGRSDLFRNLDPFSLLTCFLLCFQTGSCSTAQDGLELTM